MARRSGVCCAALIAGLFAGPAATSEPLRVQAIELAGDVIPAPLTAVPGDPARGRKIVVSRQAGLCLLCHPGPFPEAPQQGNLAPDLSGVGARLSEGQLRLRLADSRRLNPESIMPAYHRIDGLSRVGRPWRERPLLDAQQIEDVIALLRELRD